MTLVGRPVLDAPPPAPRRAAPHTPPPASHGVATVLLAVAVGGALHLAWWSWLAGSGGDIAAQDAWADFARTHPGSAYNLAWYGGMHPVSYSVLSPYLMAAVGVRPTMVVVGTLSAGLLARLSMRGPTTAARIWPAVYGAAALTGNAVSGRVTFALGTLFGLVALCAVFAWPARWSGARWRWPRGALAVTTAVLATAASPVAGAFLGVVAAALWLSRRRAAAYAIGLPPVLVVALSAVFFPFSGEQPMTWSSAILPTAAGAAVALLAPAPWRTLRLGGVVYVVAVGLAWLVPSPVGTNVSRLGLLFAGVALVAVATSGRVASSVAGRRLGRVGATALLALALTTCTVWQVATAARDAISTTPPASWTADLTPLVNQLERRDADLGRVEVVPTRSHREAAALAPHVNLARGWNRQADAERNPMFYRDAPLTADRYRRWLDRWAVRYVVLSTAVPDPAAEAEARLVASGLPYLRQVWSNADWTLLEVRRPTPLVSPPATVLEFSAAQIALFTPRAGPVVVRIADSPWLSLVDRAGEPLDDPSGAAGEGHAACLSDLDGVGSAERARRRPNDWLVLHAPAPGTYRIAAPYKLPRGTTCS